MIRGIRGAITANKNTADEILNATTILLKKMVQANKIKTEDIASTFFSTTTDLNAEFPAKAARRMGWEGVPLLCAQEIEVPKSMSKCIRILIHLNTDKKQSEIKHIYLRKAINLRK